MVASARRSHQHKKRQGKHQPRTKDFLKVYWPYVPLLAIVIFGMVLSSQYRPRFRGGVLAYATSMSQQALLNATNSQRASYGQGNLALNSALNQAAQSKANDMAARDYWSHDTPEGNPPWVFIDASGYVYQKAGENLAYGYATSEDAVIGWMNSPSHKDNVLGDYIDVGFGFANNSNYQGTGPETIVVAMYGKPAGAVASATPTPKPVVKAEAQAQAQPAPTPAPAPTPEPVAPVEAEPVAAEPEEVTPLPVTTDTPIDSNLQPVAISRLAMFTNGQLAWLGGVVSGLMVAGILSLIIKHGLALRKWIVKGERYVLHHILFDITVISLIGVCILASQAAGYVL